jgi:hypothetical protein
LEREMAATMESTMALTTTMAITTTMATVLGRGISVRLNVSSVGRHYANECPEKETEEAKKAEEARKPNLFRKGHVNHVNVEELYD